ncbi:MAG TPA: DUF3054 domain-containing protein [Acidimicrobiales bacterium]|nr:DUF3054 domain-containing protein [Acidimicrobiales bacterium]
MRRSAWILTDLLCLVLFVAIGRSTHDHGVTAAGLLSTLWPFALGLAAGWYLTIRRGRSGLSFRDAAVIVIATVAIGMIFRALFGQGTAVDFIIVALAFVSLMFGGWRLMLHLRRRSRA